MINKPIAIVGQTTCGKTDTAYHLARLTGYPVICGDIYQLIDKFPVCVGTTDREKYKDIKQYLYQTQNKILRADEYLNIVLPILEKEKGLVIFDNLSPEYMYCLKLRLDMIIVGLTIPSRLREIKMIFRMFKKSISGLLEVWKTTKKGITITPQESIAAYHLQRFLTGKISIESAGKAILKDASAHAKSVKGNLEGFQGIIWFEPGLDIKKTAQCIFSTLINSTEQRLEKEYISRLRWAQ